MIFKRAVAKRRAHDWMAILIEFAIVVAGVFVGTWVANLNQEHAQARARFGSWHRRTSQRRRSFRSAAAGSIAKVDQSINI